MEKSYEIKRLNHSDVSYDVYVSYISNCTYYNLAHIYKIYGEVLISALMCKTWYLRLKSF